MMDITEYNREIDKYNKETERQNRIWDSIANRFEELSELIRELRKGDKHDTTRV